MIPKTLWVSRVLWDWVMAHEEVHFREDIWRIALLKRDFAAVRRRALWVVLAPSGLVFTLTGILATRYSWAPYALCAYLFVLVLATHRFGTRLRIIAGESNRIFRSNHPRWVTTADALDAVLKEEPYRPHTLEVAVSAPADD